MENKEFQYIDSGNVSHSINLNKDDFKLVQIDKSIHDTKFKNKPTTFFKDALKRFCKNKSSVTGAIILGVLLVLSFVLPVAISYDVDTQHPAEQFLPPKLFSAGTGFWDGTVEYKNKIADPSTKDENGYMYPGESKVQGYTISFDKGSIVSISKPKEGTTNVASPYGNGGSIIISSSKLSNSSQDYIDSHAVKYFSPNLSLDLNTNSYSISYMLGDDVIEGYELGRYSITFEYLKDGETSDDIIYSNSIVLKDFDEEDSSKIINLNEVIKAFEESESKKIGEDGKPLTTNNGVYKNAYISINLEASDKISTYIPIKSFYYEVNNATDANISITDACKKLYIDSSDKLSYWNIYSFGNGSRELVGATCYYVDFVYDAYNAVYGLKEMTIDQSTIQSYIDSNRLPSDFISKRNSYINKNLYELGYDETPIVYVSSIKQSSDESGSIYYKFQCVIYNYKYMGYDSMPSFLFGTNQVGQDLLKTVFIGLRTSLLLGLISSAICFIFGLVWGSIAGYFGGLPDLLMERFTDILSGIPWIVMMTLMILKFGQSFWIFCLALCLTGWIGTSAVTRTQFYRFRGREYVLASRTLGASNARLIFRHILPNAMGTIITSSVLMIPSVIFSEATISYLGLGLKGMQSLGVILSDNQKFLQSYPHLLVVPAIIIGLLMISFNLFGNGLRDAFNPSLKGSDE